MVLYCPDAIVIVIQLSFIDILEYLLTNMRLKRNLNILFSLKSAFFPISCKRSYTAKLIFNYVKYSKRFLFGYYTYRYKLTRT